MAIVTTSNTKTITLKAGEKAILPAGAVVTSIVTSGAITVESTCGGLPPITQYKCGYFLYVTDEDANDGHPMDENHLKLGALIIGEKTHSLGVGGVWPTVENLNSKMSDTALFSFKHVKQAAVFEKRIYWAVYFQTPDTLFDKVTLRIDERGTSAISFYAKPVTAPCEDYSYSF